MGEALKMLLMMVLKGSVLLLVVLAIYVAYSMWAEPRAKAAAEAFCEATQMGESAESVTARAGAAEPDLMGPASDSPNRIYVMFTGAPPFSRHFCDVNLLGGKVIDKAYSHLD